MSDLDEAARFLARSTPLSFEQARSSLDLVARGTYPTFSVFDESPLGGLTVPDADTDPHLFMAKEGISSADLSTALREYRDLDTFDSSPWQRDELGVLSTDFINWYRWERL